jgi:hypothetical protein
MTQSEYALQQIVGLFGELLSQLAKGHLTGTYHMVLHISELEKIDYLEMPYQNTTALPFEEWAEEWLLKGEV